MSNEHPYVPLDPRGWRLAMGLRPLDLANWLEVDEHRATELEQKRDLLENAYDVVVATEPEGGAASEELRDELRRHLATTQPTLELVAKPDEHPIVEASRWVQEDLCVLVREDAWRLRAACVCFPSRWELATKIGTTLDDIHSPVPLYHDELAKPTNAFFDRLKPERSFWRLNWTLLDRASLHQPRSARVAPSGDLADWYFRVERQTLRRLARTGAIVFTIRTYVSSATALAARDEHFVTALLHSLDTAPASVQSYKGWVGVAQRLRAGLGAQ